MTVAFNRATLQGACGVGILYGFRQTPDGYQSSYYGHSNNIGHVPGGAGWVSFGLINTKACKEMFNVMKSKYKIVFLAEKRKNSNSGNSFSFVIFDKTKPVSDTVNNDGHKFPWVRTTRES